MVSLPPDPQLLERFGDLTTAQVAELDAAAVGLGVSILQLMELAGAQVARRAWELLGGPEDVDVVAGSGNNAGDGMVAARHLHAWGCSARVHLVAEESRCGEVVVAQLTALRACGVEVVTAPGGDIQDPHGLVIDALLGTGARGAPRHPAAQAISRVASSQVLSIDTPSGVDANSGETAGVAVAATDTVTLTAMKRGLWTESGQRHAGRIVVADMGMPTAAWRGLGLIAPTGVRGGGLLPISSNTP
ncbi:MAG: NAD(P)H-hydrate epimerase [Candidatus Dormibacteria bacterium]